MVYGWADMYSVFGSHDQTKCFCAVLSPGTRQLWYQGEQGGLIEVKVTKDLVVGRKFGVQAEIP